MSTTERQSDLGPFHLVRQGIPTVNVVTVVHDLRDVFIAEIDMHTKRDVPNIAFSGFDAPAEIIIWPAEPTKPVPENITVLCLPQRTGGWNVMIEGGRYTIRVAAWKRDLNGD